MTIEVPHSPRLLGIEIGGTKLQVGLGLGDGSLVNLVRLRVEPARGASGILEQIEQAVSMLLRRSNLSTNDLSVVGIGFGGPVDSEQGVVIESHQVSGWDGFPLADWARRTWGVDQVRVQNDAATAALGESRWGAGVGFDPVLYLTIGSGVGGGLIVDGAIYQGLGRGSIEIGHLIINGGDELRDRGSASGPETLEQVASGWSIARSGKTVVEAIPQQQPETSESTLFRVCNGRAAEVTAELVAKAAFEGDPDALAILSKARIAVGQAIAHAVTLLAPARVILGGGVSRIGEKHWFEPIRQEVDRRVFAPFRGSFEVVPAKLGEEVVVHGALALASDAGQTRSGRR